MVASFDRELERSPATSTQWSVADEDGNNILHLSARDMNLDSIRWIKSHLGTVLDSTPNKAGQTPLELLKLELKERRRLSSAEGFLKGFSRHKVTCLLLLKGFEENLPEDVFRRIQFGCTCDQCSGGFISPRVKFTLMSQAQALQDTLLHHQKSWPYGHIGCCLSELTIRLGYRIVPYRTGCLETLLWIATALISGIMPTKRNILIMMSRGPTPIPSHDRFETGGF